MRNVNQRTEEGRAIIKKNPRYELTVKEIELLFDGAFTKGGYEITDRLWRFMDSCFHFGVCVGYRIAQRERTK